MNKIPFDHIEGSAPILLELPHSGTEGMTEKTALDPFPEVFEWDKPAAMATLRLGADISVPEMTNARGLAEELGLHFLQARWPRVFLDVNRDIHDLSASAAGPTFPRDQHGHGLIWSSNLPQASTPEEALERIEIILRRPLTPLEIEALMMRYYRPYHAAIQKSHAAMKEMHRRAIHLALHTFPPQKPGGVKGSYYFGGQVAYGVDFPSELPDIVLIHNTFKAADRDLIEVVASTFRREGLLVVHGTGPLAGANGVTGIYGRPDTGTHVIGIEHIGWHETGRAQGEMDYDHEKARSFQTAYRRVVEGVLEWTRS